MPLEIDLLELTTRWQLDGCRSGSREAQRGKTIHNARKTTGRHGTVLSEESSTRERPEGRVQAGCGFNSSNTHPSERYRRNPVESKDFRRSVSELCRRRSGIRDKPFHLVGILSPRRFLDTAGDIDAVRPNDANRLRDVLRSQSTGQNQRHARLVVREQIPRRRLARCRLPCLPQRHRPGSRPAVDRRTGTCRDSDRSRPGTGDRGCERPRRRLNGNGSATSRFSPCIWIARSPNWYAIAVICRSGSPTNTPTPAIKGGIDRRSGWLCFGSTYREDCGWKLTPTASAPAAAHAATSAGVVTPQILTRRGCIGGLGLGLVFGQSEELDQRAAEARQGIAAVNLLVGSQGLRRPTRTVDAHGPIVRINQPDQLNAVVDVVVDFLQYAVHTVVGRDHFNGKDRTGARRTWDVGPGIDERP